MAKNVSNVAQAPVVTVASLSTDALLPSLGSQLLSSQPLSSKRFAVVGKGLRRNNLLLAQVLQADIQRWYPWSALQYGVSKQATSVLSKLPLPTFITQSSTALSGSLPDAFIGWGHKKSYQRATNAAKKQQLASLSIEDGFLRSLDSGINSRHGVSMIVDDIGIYFDLNQPSRLEQLIIERVQNDNCSPKSKLDKSRAQPLISTICNEQLSKYNAVTYCPSLDELAANSDINSAIAAIKPHILLIDQVIGDASIKGAGADKRQFKRMLKIACRTHPDAHIWIKAHPAAKSGYLTTLKLPKNVGVLSQVLNPIKLLEQVSHVYTVSSHMGFEALMLGKTVHCFGVSWYSGWGLTDDSAAPKALLNNVKERRQALFNSMNSNDDKAIKTVGLAPKNQASPTLTASLETLFYSAYIDYSHYVDPATKQACDIDTAIQWLLTNRRWQTHLAGNLTVYEFSRWKLPFVKAFVDFPLTTLFIKPKPRLKNVLHPDHYRVNYQHSLLVWGLAKRQQLHRKFIKQQLAEVPSIYCMEDGFIRSNGLGATLLAPLSVVIDKLGIYYDATQPSDLETLLRDCHALTPEQALRVQALQVKLLTQRVSKYNVGVNINDNKATNGTQTSWIEVARTTSKPRLLIVGQVEDDLSVQYCGSQIKTNSALIERVRQDNPDAYLIYKPHPDVEAGLRTGKVAPEHLQKIQAVAHDTAMPDCLACVDEVHTMSSLTGFEALLRDLKVVCYGLPFYAGWGLTIDKDTNYSPKSDYLPRRKRQTPLTIEQLIYCTLISYPLYRLPDSYGLAQVEQVIDYLYSPSTLTHDRETANSSDNATDKARNVASLSITQLTAIPLQLKRQVNTRFMQQRHLIQQFLRKK